MTRSLVALLVALVVLVAAGYLALLNPGDADVKLQPARPVNTPLAAALVVAFAAGAILVGAAATVAAGTRGWRHWRAQRHARRTGRGAAVVAHAAQLAWGGDFAGARAALARARKAAPRDVT